MGDYQHPISNTSLTLNNFVIALVYTYVKCHYVILQKVSIKVFISFSLYIVQTEAPMTYRGCLSESHSRSIGDILQDDLIFAGCQRSA